MDQELWGLWRAFALRHPALVAERLRVLLAARGGAVFVAPLLHGLVGTDRSTAQPMEAVVAHLSGLDIDLAMAAIQEWQERYPAVPSPESVTQVVRVFVFVDLPLRDAPVSARVGCPHRTDRCGHQRREQRAW